MLRIKQLDSSLSTHHEEQSYVPLKKVRVEGRIRSFAADVTITQVFRNDETKPVEAVYCFPIEEKAAIYSFVAHIDDREIHAQLKEKKEAQQEYNNALQQGHGAYLLEQDENSQDNFIINVGALPPSKECQITISYVTELEYADKSTIRFVIPTTIAPRYNPDKGALTSPANTNSQYVQLCPYTIQFQCYVDKMNDLEQEYITRINSPSHPIQIDFSQKEFYLITFSQENIHLDRDILINIELNEKRSNTILAVESGAVMAVFTPTEEDCRQQSNSDQMNEFLFVIDCSGSMQDENKIGLARQAMLLFLKSLPVNCYFNIIRFGSQYKTLFNEVTSIYNEENVKNAEQLINRIQADLGGTELMKPLEWIGENSPIEGRSRQIFLLTDGEISNVTEVLDLCRSMASSTRIFSFGLGKSPSRSLVKGLARSTNGRFVFIPPYSKVDTYVGQQLEKALQPSIINIDVHWNLGIECQTAPSQLPPVYLNERLLVYALMNDRTIPFDHNYVVELKTKLTNRSLGISKIDRIPNVSENETIARLAAKTLILELQHQKMAKPHRGSMQSRFEEILATNEGKMEEKISEEGVKQRIIDLSLKYKILSPYTAFVGIEKRPNSSNAEMILREVPIEISADDKNLYRSAPMRLPTSGWNLNSSNLDRSAAVFTGCAMDTLELRSQSLDRLSTGANLRSMDTIRLHSTRHLTKSSGACCGSSSRGTDQLSYRQANSILQRRETPETYSGRNESYKASQRDDTLPSNDEDIVRYLIKKQRFNGLWDLDDEVIMKLTGKPLSVFQATNSDINKQVLLSIIIVVILETRFTSFSSLWHGVVQKARKQVRDLVIEDSKDFDRLLEDIQKQI